MLLGRELERRRIDELLGVARRGEGAGLVLRGEAGIGKSALLAYAAGSAQGLRVLHTRGLEGEAPLAYRGLHDLLLPLTTLLDRIPAPQADALRGALAIGPEPSGPQAVAAGTLSLLAAAAEVEPLVVTVDDLQWIDSSSADAILFSARRLVGNPVALLLAVRADETEFEAPGLDELVLEGLNPDHSAELVLRARSEMAASVTARLVKATNGNPLALVELPQLLDESQARGESPLPDPLPAAASIERAFQRRAAGLSEAARTALTLAAALGDGDTGVLGRALGSLGVDARESLEEGERAGVVLLRPGSFDFVHPLARSALYQAALPADLRRAHAALADALDPGAAPDLRAWHLSEAATEPDEELAAALESSADRAVRRGGYRSAASARERAAELSVDEEGRARRFALAGDAAQLAGLGERALALLDKALAAEGDPMRRAEIQNSRGFILYWRGKFDEAREAWRQAVQIEAFDREKAAVIYHELLGPCYERGDPAGVLEMGQRSYELAPRDGGWIEFMGATAMGFGLMYNGRAREARPYLLRGGEIAETNPDSFDDPVWLAIGGAALCFAEEDFRAQAFFERLIGEARATSSFGVLTFLLPALAGLERELGNWPRSRALAVECVELSLDTGQTINLANGRNECAHLSALVGREKECREIAGEAAALAQETGSFASLVWTREALGALELGLGNTEQAIAQLEPILMQVVERGIGEPQMTASLPNLIEAYVRAKRPTDAEILLAYFETLAADSGYVGQSAPAARCRGLLASATDFAEAFEIGLGHCERLPRPFERARIELSFGERLRRSGHRVDARTHLRQALAIFEQLGAKPWAEKARSELRASGETIRAHDPTARDELTPQELKVALVIADGASNQEAAAALFLSPKTIEAHLGRAYRKLGIRSRSELARRLAPAAGATITPLGEEERLAAS
jgi:DNA-binding CsgD family transcriptional regulator